jgi:hypothetical protein
MIFFFRNGQLGNQLFQYYGLRKYFPNQNLIFFGCEDLKKSVDNIAVKFIFKRQELTNFFIRVLRIIFLLLTKVRIFGKITHSVEKKKFEIFVKHGFLSNVYIAHSIFFQHQDCIQNIDVVPVLKNKLFKFAKDWLKKKKILSFKNRLVFVHIRRGDYLSWPSPKYPAFADISWYRLAMLKIKKKINKPIFIIMSDDLSYVRKYFKETNFLIISNNQAEEDLAIMSMCSGGILSPSSFGWWGAFMARSKKVDKVNSYFISPKFWAGHRKKKWFPAYFYTNWISYI